MKSQGNEETASQGGWSVSVFAPLGFDFLPEFLQVSERFRVWNGEMLDGDVHDGGFRWNPLGFGRLGLPILGGKEVTDLTLGWVRSRSEIDGSGDFFN